MFNLLIGPMIEIFLDDKSIDGFTLTHFLVDVYEVIRIVEI